MADGSLRVALKTGSSLYLPDLAPFLPLLGKMPFHTTFNTLDIEGNTENARVTLDADFG